MKQGFLMMSHHFSYLFLSLLLKKKVFWPYLKYGVYLFGCCLSLYDKVSKIVSPDFTLKLRYFCTTQKWLILILVSWVELMNNHSCKNSNLQHGLLLQACMPENKQNGNKHIKCHYILAPCLQWSVYVIAEQFIWSMAWKDLKERKCTKCWKINFNNKKSGMLKSPLLTGEALAGRLSPLMIC